MSFQVISRIKVFFYYKTALFYTLAVTEIQCNSLYRIPMILHFQCHNSMAVLWKWIRIITGLNGECTEGIQLCLAFSFWTLFPSTEGVVFVERICTSMNKVFLVFMLDLYPHIAKSHCNSKVTPFWQCVMFTPWIIEKMVMCPHSWIQCPIRRLRFKTNCTRAERLNASNASSKCVKFPMNWRIYQMYPSQPRLTQDSAHANGWLTVARQQDR